MALLNFERETIITFNEEEKNAEIEVFNVKLKNKLEKLTKSHPNDCKLIEHRKYSDVYSFNKKWVKINAPIKQSLTEEERLVRAERIKAVLSKKISR